MAGDVAGAIVLRRNDVDERTVFTERYILAGSPGRPGSIASDVARDAPTKLSFGRPYTRMLCSTSKGLQLSLPWCMRKFECTSFVVFVSICSSWYVCRSLCVHSNQLPSPCDTSSLAPPPFHESGGQRIGQRRFVRGSFRGQEGAVRSHDYDDIAEIVA